MVTIFVDHVTTILAKRWIIVTNFGKKVDHHCERQVHIFWQKGESSSRTAGAHFFISGEAAAGIMFLVCGVRLWPYYLKNLDGVQLPYSADWSRFVVHHTGATGGCSTTINNLSHDRWSLYGCATPPVTSLDD